MQVGERIKKRRKELGYNADYLAEKTGLSRSTIFRYEKGDIEKISSEVLAKFARVLSTTPEKLMGWEDEKLISQLVEVTKRLSLEQQKQVLTFAQGQLTSLKSDENRKILALHSKRSSSLYEVKGVSEAAAGLGYGYDDAEAYTVWTDEEPPAHDLATMISGDSMEPDFSDGDMLYLRESSKSSFQGELAVVALNDRTYFKKVYLEKGRLRLLSLNPLYEPLEFSLDEDTHLKLYDVVGSFTPLSH